MCTIKGAVRVTKKDEKWNCQLGTNYMYEVFALKVRNMKKQPGTPGIVSL